MGAAAELFPPACRGSRGGSGSRGPDAGPAPGARRRAPRRAFRRSARRGALLGPVEPRGHRSRARPARGSGRARPARLRPGSCGRSPPLSPRESPARCPSPRRPRPRPAWWSGVPATARRRRTPRNRAGREATSAGCSASSPRRHRSRGRTTVGPRPGPCCASRDRRCTARGRPIRARARDGRRRGGVRTRCRATGSRGPPALCRSQRARRARRPRTPRRRTPQRHEGGPNARSRVGRT